MAKIAYRAVTDSGIPMECGCGSGQRTRGIPNRQGSESGIRQAQAAGDRIASGRTENSQAERTARRICRVTDARHRQRCGVRHRVGRTAGQNAHPVEGQRPRRIGRTQPRAVGVGVIQIAPQIRILVAVEAIDGRKGIDALAQLCREKLDADPFSGYLFIFRTRRGTAIRVLAYDGQGFWLAHKTVVQGSFPMVAHRHGSGANAASASGATAARGRQS